MEDINDSLGNTIARAKKSTWLSWPLPIALLLLLPHLVWGPVPHVPHSLAIGLPRVYSGDEPHYLLMLNSLLNDGDLDLSNNYVSVHRGGDQAGLIHAGAAIDHHVAWIDKGRLVLWKEIYETSPEKWRKDEFGHPVPTLSRKAQGVVIPPREYSWHQPGMPILLALLLIPLYGTPFIEPAALFCSGISTVVAMFFFHAFVRSYSTNPRDALEVTAVAFLGTPIWHYGRTLFTEPYLLACAVCAYTLYLRYGRHFTAGCILGVGIMIKRTTILLFFPLIADALFRRDWIGALKVLGTLVGSLVLLVIQNQYFYGSVIGWDTQIPLGNPLEGALSLTFSRDFGLVPFAPAALVALAAWPDFFRRHFRDAAILSSAFLIYFGFCASLSFWEGGYCYGPRYLVPVLPFLFAAFPALVYESGKDLLAQRVIVLLLLLSFWINMMGAFACGNVWGAHPASLLNP